MTINEFNPKHVALGSLLETTARQPLMAIASYAVENQCSSAFAIRKLYSTGGVMRFYSGFQGLLVGFSSRTTHRVSTFAINEWMKSKNHSLLSTAITAACFETASTLISENFLTSAQAENKSTSILEIVKNRYNKYGIRAFSIGMKAAMGRNISFNLFYFGPGYYYPTWTNQHPVLSAVVAGSSAVMGSHLFEVLRIRKTTNPETSYASIVNSMRHNILHKGIAPRFGSVGVGSIITMLVVQCLKQKEI